MRNEIRCTRCSDTVGPFIGRGASARCETCDGVLLRATLTTLAERWEQCANSLGVDLPQEFFVEADTGQQWAATVAHNHRTAARDLREVLRTGCIPNGWMTAAEEEQYGATEETAS